jgi:hypothetical protein
LTISLKDAPGGADKLRMGRTFVVSSLAISILTRKFGKGGVSNGPATNFFLIQVAMVSVMISPFRVAELAFLQNISPSG